jgi:hypothetical protein
VKYGVSKYIFFTINFPFEARTVWIGVESLTHTLPRYQIVEVRFA